MRHVLALFFAALALPAAAQTLPTAGQYYPPGTAIPTSAQGVEQVGLDSVTGLRCMVGESSTCQVPVSGSGGGGGGTSSNFGSAFPTAGTAIGVKNGANMVNLTADGSGNLDVNCLVGCAGGSTSNATSGVATSSTNGASVVWNYGFNGTTWDQLQVDASKFLKVTIAASAASNISTNMAQVGGTNVVTGGVNGSQGVGGLAAAGSAIIGNPVLVGGSDGTNARAIATDTSGNQKVVIVSGTANLGNLNSDTHGQCSALCANLVLKASAGVLKTFEVQADSTLSAAAWYVMVYDATSAPADGAVTPAKCYQQSAGTPQMGGTLGPGGTGYTTGVTIGVSTTGCFTKTASTHAFIAGDFQ